MTNKAYIVANEQQEREVLEKLEQEGYEWLKRSKNPTDFIPSVSSFVEFPYVLINKGNVRWSSLNEFDNDATVVYDGRKEEQMSDKYVVSQEFMNELKKWKDNLSNIDDGPYISPDDFIDLPVNIMEWRDDSKYTKENNNRLIAIIRWVNGEDVFEIEKPKRWVVRSKETDSKGSHLYVFVSKDDALCYSCLGLVNATHFATKEEAQSWTNSHQEVIEVEE